jgi:hypothetical protein
MRKQFHWALSTAMGLGAAALVGCDRNNTPVNQHKDASPQADSKVLNNKGDAASVAGSKIPGDQIGTADLGKIYGVLSDVSEAAYTNGGYDDLVERLSADDRNRIGKFAEQKFADLDGRADKFNGDFKSKYNGAFKLNDNKIFENWAQVQKTGEDKDKLYANVMIPASHGMPGVTVKVVKDKEAWKIDLPDDVSGEQLKKNLVDHITMADQMKDTWPTDKLEAQRVLVHHALMALTNTPSALPLK